MFKILHELLLSYKPLNAQKNYFIWKKYKKKVIFKKLLLRFFYSIHSVLLGLRAIKASNEAEQAPAEKPNNVVFLGSPPNIPICLLTHCKAINWSYIPRSFEPASALLNG